MLEVRSLFALVLLAATLGPPAAVAQPLRLILPTSNDGLITGDYPSFFQFTDRMFQGVRTHPWEGGQYGFVRNQKMTPAGIVFTKFHEGVDIKAVHRDARGEPLDTVWAVDDGRVVYVNRNARASSYGRYVVVEHIWSGMPFYSLYAHLGSAQVAEGQRVRQRQMLGKMGYTGRGIDRRRAHVHFEINLMLNADFKRWHTAYFRSNPHGLYNGVNLSGLNVAALYLELQRNRDLTIEEFLRSQEATYVVRVPNDGALDVHYRYPWLSEYGYDATAPSLEISMAASGLPLRIESSYESAIDPIVVQARPLNVSYEYASNGLLTGRHNPALTASGRRYIQLITTEARFPADTMLLAGRVLAPPSPEYPAPRRMRPASADTMMRRTPLAEAPSVAPVTAVDGPVEQRSDRESSGGEVRGW